MDDSLYRVVRMDPKAGNRPSVRYGTIHTVAGMVRDVKATNANRLRISQKFDNRGRYPYEPVTLLIQRVIVSSYKDATSEFLKDGDDGNSDGGGGTREPGGNGPDSPSPDDSGLCGADPFDRSSGSATLMPLIREPVIW